MGSEADCAGVHTAAGPDADCRPECRGRDVASPQAERARGGCGKERTPSFVSLAGMTRRPQSQMEEEYVPQLQHLPTKKINNAPTQLRILKSLG